MKFLPINLALKCVKLYVKRCEKKMARFHTLFHVSFTCLSHYKISHACEKNVKHAWKGVKIMKTVWNKPSFHTLFHMVFTRLLLVVFIRSFLETDQQFTKFSEKANKIQEEEKSREEVQDSMALVFRFPSYHSYRYCKLHSKFLCKSISSRTFFCVCQLFPLYFRIGSTSV